MSLRPDDGNVSHCQPSPGCAHSLGHWLDFICPQNIQMTCDITWMNCTPRQAHTQGEEFWGSALPSFTSFTSSSWRHSWCHLPHQGWKKKMRNHGRGKEEVGEGGHRAEAQKKRASLESPRSCSKHLGPRGGGHHRHTGTSLKMLLPGKKRKCVCTSRCT